LSFENKVAVITGGRQGIGHAIASLFAKLGADIVIADCQAEESATAAKLIASVFGKRVISIPTDVADHIAAMRLVDQTLAEFGRIDILVNNAGVTRDTLILRMSEEDWDFVLSTNLKGAWNCSKAAVRPMIKQRYGRIVNISSVSGLAGQAGQTNYSASKAGLIGMSKALAREVASRGITVNVVAPGFVTTSLTRNLPEDFIDTTMKMIPIGRWGKPEEIAQAVAFFASDEACYITGQVLSVDGGMMMM
jgi:3-oxoacyl-[acyl-carrier protein] reductase